MRKEKDISVPLTFLDRFIRTTITSSKPPLPENVRIPSFRASSLPYCPIFFLREMADSLERVEPEDYSKMFYTGIGTAVHEALQGYAPELHGNTFCGQWQCSRKLEVVEGDGKVTVSRCTHSTKGITSQSEMDIGTCPHGKTGCRKYFGYKEVDIDFHGLSGHVDGIVRRGDSYWIVDFKTTGSKLFGPDADGVIDRGFYPSQKYLVQIETYCALLEKIYGIDIEGYSICYINRETTFNDRGYGKPVPSWRNFAYWWTEEKRAAVQDRLRREIKGNKVVKAILSEKDPDEIRRLAETIYDLRPCVNESSYKKNMDCKWFSSEKCPYAGKCWNDSYGMIEEVEKHVEAIQEELEAADKLRESGTQE